MTLSVILLALLAHTDDRILVGVHQTGAVSTESKQTPFLEAQLHRPLGENIEAWGRLQLIYTPQAVAELRQNQLAEAAEFQTGLARALRRYQGHDLAAIVSYGAAAHFHGDRTYRQYAAGVRITGPSQSVYQATIGQDQQVSPNGVVMRFELTHPIAGTPWTLVASTNLRVGRPGPRDTYRIGLALNVGGLRR